MKVIRTEDAVSEARRSIAGGASIIIARGLQASLIKQYTDIPVIAVVGFRNMFCDMSSLFLSITEDSLRNAFAMAESMDYAMGTQKRSEAQLETLLDNSFSGVARMDRDGKITDVNPVMEDILGKPKAEVLGIAAAPIPCFYKKTAPPSLPSWRQW